MSGRDQVIGITCRTGASGSNPHSRFATAPPHSQKPLRLFYQQPGGPIGQAVHVDGVWSQAPPPFNAVPLSPLASVTWNEGKEVSTPLCFHP